MNKFRLAILGVIFIMMSCGGGGGTDYPSQVSSQDSSSTAASITLSASPSSITVNGTSSISATVLDSGGSSVDDGTTVTFSVSSSTLGSITSTASTSSGVATATFTASTTAGTVTITATAGSATQTTTVTIAAATAGSIEFTSASPTVIGITGSGQTDTSTITFTVKDVNGNAITDGTQVDFVMSGPGGGAYIDTDASPTTKSVSTSSGSATVQLHSGTVAGPVVIVATVNGTSISSASTPISIGGGVPNDDHLTIATDTWNLEGLGWANIQANISVYMADRFGNFNVLQGTAVSFYAESGAIDRNDVTDSSGSASVVFRTQNPNPEDVTPIGGSSCSGSPTTLTQVFTTYVSEWESCLQQYVLDIYDDVTTKPSGHPRDGWATIMVATRGEEAFDDADADGVYDTGESFTDTSHEAFVDVDDDDTRDTSPFEEFIDDDGDSSYDGANSSWDSDKTIFKDIKLLITGAPSYIETDPTDGFTVSADSSQAFKLLISDVNLNPLIGGSKVAISSSKGTISSGSSYTFPDQFNEGPIELSFTLDTSSLSAGDPITIEIKVTHKSTDYYAYVTGSVI